MQSSDAISRACSYCSFWSSQIRYIVRWVDFHVLTLSFWGNCCLCLWFLYLNLEGFLGNMAGTCFYISSTETPPVPPSCNIWWWLQWWTGVYHVMLGSKCQWAKRLAKWLNSGGIFFSHWTNNHPWWFSNTGLVCLIKWLYGEGLAQVFTRGGF